MLSTLGFLGMAGQHSYSEVPRISIIFRFWLTWSRPLGVLIPGGILGTHIQPGAANTALILRRVGAGIYVGLYIALVL
ncbi:hypothetical protein BDQ17DRAFT_1030659 [Cyathus striatus]|nr:hypothetical protein BDQ17DRAFT_1030659 [Cyathus striatus]